MKTINTLFTCIVFAFAFTVFAPRARAADTVLYIFAHQDDELGITAKIASDARQGRVVHAVWLTDGSGTADPAVREAESRAVMQYLGVPQENLHFLGYRDRDSWKSLEAIYRDVIKIVAEIHPSEITCIAYEGGNIDHDSTSIITYTVSQRAASVKKVFEYSLYNTYKGQYRMCEFIPRDDTPTLYTKFDRELFDKKLGVLDMYPSQAAIVGALKSFIDKKKMKKLGEPYRAMPAYDYATPPTAGPIGYEADKRNPVSFEQNWKPAATAFLKKWESGELDSPKQD
jgi:LmbE family N-acetylglucosaminyl deacetylase